MNFKRKIMILAMIIISIITIALTGGTVRATEEMPTTTTVTEERVISETTRLNWKHIDWNLNINVDEIQLNYANLSYKVKYYYDGQIDNNKTEIFTSVAKGTEISTYPNKKVNGYKLSKVKNVPLVISEKENVIEVYYEKNKENKKDPTDTDSKANIEVTKIAPETINAGTNMTYQISLTNTTEVAGEVDITDTLPEGVTYISSTNEGMENNGTITWKNIKIKAKETVELGITVKVNENKIGALITNTVELSNGKTSTATTKVNELTGEVKEIVQGETNKDDVNVVLVIDISTSMRTIDDGNISSRVELAKAAAKSFVQTLYANENNKDATISLVLFNKTASILQVNSKNISTYSNKDDLISAIEGVSISVQGTNMYDGLLKAEDIINNTLKTTMPYSNNRNVVVFLGDGEPYGGNTQYNNSSGIINKANTIKNGGTILYTIGFGKNAATESESTSSAYYILQNMASPGKFRTAILGSEIASVFVNIAEQERSTNKTTILGILNLEISNDLIINENSPLILKYNEIELFKSTNLNDLSKYNLEYDSINKKLIWNVNKWNEALANTKVITNNIEINYYIQR